MSKAPPTGAIAKCAAGGKVQPKKDLGMMAMPLIPFILASIVGRGARFFLVAGLIVFAGSYFQDDEELIQAIRRYIDAAGWLVIVLLLIFVLTLM